MRNAGVVFLALGILGFLYAGSRVDQADPAPEGISIGESLHYASGRWEIARYGLAAVAGMGLLLLLFPKGR